MLPLRPTAPAGDSATGEIAILISSSPSRAILLHHQDVDSLRTTTTTTSHIHFSSRTS